MALSRLFQQKKGTKIHKTNDKKSQDDIKMDKQYSQKERYDGIYPDLNSIETTQQISKRTTLPVNHVVHDVNWSDVFDKSILPNKTQWQFNPKCKTIVEKGKDAWTISMLSATECDKLVELCEIYGFEDCGYPKGYRSNTRLISDDKAFADGLYERIKTCCPKRYKSDGTIWEICGLNERFRWCKYVKGQLFGMHCDARFLRNSTEQSFYTVNVYLNDGRKDFEGGRTCFFNPDKKTSQWKMSTAVVPATGTALIFNQWPDHIQHNGEVLKKGVKYLMRTDVMYKELRI